MKITRVHTDDRGSFIEFLAPPKIVEIDKKFVAGGVEYDTPELAESARTELKKINPDVVTEKGMEEKVEAISQKETITGVFDVKIKVDAQGVPIIEESLWSKALSLIAL